MKGKNPSSRLKSYGYAFHGIYMVFSTQVNFRIQAGFALIGIILGFLLPISTN